MVFIIVGKKYSPELNICQSFEGGKCICKNGVNCGKWDDNVRFNI